MSKPLLAGRELLTRPLGLMVSIDPESLPLGTNPSFEFHYFDISCAANGRLQIPDTSITYAEAPSRARRIVKNSDVLMSTVRPNLKAFAYCNMPEGSYVASTGFAVLRAVEGNDPRYILYSILSDDVARQIESYVVGSNYPAINSSDVKRLQIPDWKPPQQRRIAVILSTVDEAIEQTEALIAKYQQIKAGLMHDLFTRGLSPEASAKGGVTWTLRPIRAQAPHLYKESPLGWIPKVWEVKPLDEHVRIIDCKHYTPAFQTEGFPFIRPRNVKIEGLDLQRVDYVSAEDFQMLTDVHLPRRGDIVFSRNASFGVPCYIDTDLPFAIGQDCVIMTSKASDTRFVLCALANSITASQIAKVSSGSTFGRINLGEIRQILIPYPGIEEEQRIADRLFCFDKYSKKLKEELGKLRQQKLGLMHDLLTGRVHMKVVEPASI